MSCSVPNVCGYVHAVILLQTELFAFFEQVLFLHGLSLMLGQTYVVQWDTMAEDYQRFDCHPEENADEAKCKARGCIWKVRNGSV